MVLERETEGECLMKRDAPAVLPAALPLPPGWEEDERLASEEDKRGLPADVTARERLPLPTGAIA